jgi:hypothetical protein
MASKKKAQEDITVPECDEYGPPTKKRKMESLLLDVANQTLVNLKSLVEGTLAVMLNGNSSLSEKEILVFIPELFDSNISEEIIAFFAKQYPNVRVRKTEETSKDSERFILLTIEHIIELLESIGSVCFFNRDAVVRVYGYACCQDATKLREKFDVPKTILSQSKWQKLALRNKCEFQTVGELKKLLGERPTHWNTQALLVGERLMKKYAAVFPNKFIIYNMVNYAIAIWNAPWADRSRPSYRLRSCAIFNYLFELFGTEELMHELIVNPMETQDVVHLTVTEFFNTLRDPQQNQTEQDLPFDHLITSLVYSFAYQVRVRDHAPTEEIVVTPKLTIKSKADKLQEISEVILVLLQLLVSIPKSKTESSDLKYRLETHIINYENECINQLPNLLLKACKAYKGHENDFKLINFLLESGANPNVVDQHRRSPLHLLAKIERASSKLWSSTSYSTRAESFNSIVRVILDGRYHEDQVNSQGASALKCLQSSRLKYPNAQLCRLLGNFLQGVRPLSCMAAEVVRRNQLPCKCLPVALQFMVLQH